MAFIDRAIGDDETLIGITSVHWIYGLKGLSWFVLFLFGGLYIDRNLSGLLAGHRGSSPDRGLHIFADYAFWTCSFIGAVILLFYIIMMVSTELGLTTKRVIYKRGLIMVDVKEADLEEVKAAEVDNGILGSLLGYGYVVIDARFVANMTLPAIAEPYKFIKAMNKACSALKTDSMKVVLEHTRTPEAKRAIEETLHEEHHEAEAGAHEPTVFKRDPERYKNNLRQKVKRIFSRNSGIFKK